MLYYTDNNIINVMMKENMIVTWRWMMETEERKYESREWWQWKWRTSVWYIIPVMATYDLLLLWNEENDNWRIGQMCEMIYNDYYREEEAQ